MALGLNTETSSGDFLGRVQYDAKAGRLFDIIREQDAAGNWVSTPKEIRLPVKLAMDLENIEVGYIRLGGGVVDFRMVKLGQPLPPKPDGVDAQGRPLYRQGFRVKVYSKNTLGGVKHWNHSAKCVLAAVDALHDAYQAQKAQHPGKVPVVELVETTPVTTGQGEKRSTNYAPVFRIVSWIDRPAELDGGEAEPEPAAQPQTPPATGGTHMPPPQQAQTAPAPEEEPEFV